MNSEATETAETALPPDLQHVMNDFVSLKRDLAELLKHAKKGAAKGAGETADAVRSSVARLVYGDEPDDGASAVETASRLVQEKPLLSLIIAFGIGVVASRLMSR